MPTDSYLRSWISLHQQNFPDLGWEAEVYSETVGSYEDSGTERVSFGDMAVIPAQVIGGDRVT